MEQKDVHKISFRRFLAEEVAIYSAQIFIVFCVASFYSNFLSDEGKLIEFANSKINASTLSEIGLTMLAFTVALGLISVMARVSESTFLEGIFDKVMQEAPRTAYFFGSTIAGSMCAISLSITINDDAPGIKQLAGYMLSFMSATVFFLYGFFASRWLNKNRIISKSTVALTVNNDSSSSQK